MIPAARLPRLAFAAAFSMFAACGLSAQTLAWKPFESLSDNFSASFPANPTISRNMVPVGADKFELRSYDATDHATEFYIGVCDYGARGAAADAQEMLDGAKRGSIAHMNAHILTEKPILLAGNPGLTFEAENDKLHFSMRLYKVSGVLYQLMVAAPLATATQPTANGEVVRFLDSFQIGVPAMTPAAAAVASPNPSASRLAAPGPTSPVPNGWKVYRLPADGFSITLPAEPRTSKQNVSTDEGQFELRTYMTEDGTASLIAAVCDYGKSAQNKDPQTLLANARNGAVANLKAHIVTDSALNSGAHPGVAFEAENDTDHISARFFLVGNLLYQLFAIAPIKDHYANAPAFLDSFSLMDAGGH